MEFDFGMPSVKLPSMRLSNVLCPLRFNIYGFVPLRSLAIRQIVSPILSS